MQGRVEGRVREERERLWKVPDVKREAKIESLVSGYNSVATRSNHTRKLKATKPQSVYTEVAVFIFLFEKSMSTMDEAWAPLLIESGALFFVPVVPLAAAVVLSFEPRGATIVP